MVEKSSKKDGPKEEDTEPLEDGDAYKAAKVFEKSAENTENDPVDDNADIDAMFDKMGL